MQVRNKKANRIILIIFFLMVILLMIIMVLLYLLQGNAKNTNKDDDNISISTGKSEKKPKTVKEVIEEPGSVYIDMKKDIFTRIYADFAYDLYKENGESNEKYFKDIIKQIVDIQKDSFYLIDEENKIEIFVNYDKETGKYKILINNVEDFYDETDGDVYVDLSNTKITRKTLNIVMNPLLQNLQYKEMYYANTIIATGEKEEMPNGYYNYPEAGIMAKLNGGKVVNIIFTKDYKDSVMDTYKVGTPLSDIYEAYPNPSFGSVRDGFLGYRLDYYYIFFYEDEISLYAYQYDENKYFDTYLKEYDESGDLDKLVSDFTTEWSTYFEFKYDAEAKDLLLTFPTRGIELDIKDNDSRGIKIYNNYYLTDTVIELIKRGKITLEPKKDLILITEENRRESMK